MGFFKLSVYIKINAIIIIGTTTIAPEIKYITTKNITTNGRSIIAATVEDVKKWKQESRGVMRLMIGLLLIAMGWLLIFIANGTLNFG